MLKELTLIKRIYGEEMMKFCRKEFSTILEKEGLLLHTLETNFNRSRFLYEDIVKANKLNNFSWYIKSKTILKKNFEKAANFTPEELLKKEGYTLYKCNTKEEIEQFTKYYTNREMLCTFRQNRLDTHYVYFAVKDNASEIKRKDFKNPQRQDEYGTSVLSIQFSKGEINDVSIICRYNHTVLNPGGTFSNNLDYIVPGLTASFKKHENMVQKEKEDLKLRGYIKGPDKKFYKSEYHLNEIFYCENNIIIDGDVIVRLPKEKYLLMDYIIIDLQNKKIIKYNEKLKKVYGENQTKQEVKEKSIKPLEDAFFETTDQMELINIVNEEEIKIITLKTKGKDDIIIKLNKRGNIISIKDPNITHVKSSYLSYLVSLEEIDLENAKQIDHDFLSETSKITKLNLPNTEIIGDNFLRNAINIKKINLPKAIQIGNNFIMQGNLVSEVYLPKVKKIGFNFIALNWNIKILILENLEYAGESFLMYNKSLKEIYAPNLIEAGARFLYSNRDLIYIYSPKLIKVGIEFMFYNEKIESIFMPKLKTKPQGFMQNLYNHQNLENFYNRGMLPNIKIKTKRRFIL